MESSLDIQNIVSRLKFGCGRVTRPHATRDWLLWRVTKPRSSRVTRCMDYDCDRNSLIRQFPTLSYIKPVDVGAEETSDPGKQHLTPHRQPTPATQTQLSQWPTLCLVGSLAQTGCHVLGCKDRSHKMYKYLTKLGLSNCPVLNEGVRFH